MKYIVRLQSVELKHFKNIEEGKISINSGTSNRDILRNLSVENLTSDVLGIYGQNGSGKSAIVDALFFLKQLLQGEALPPDSANYIQYNKKFFECIFTFFLLPKGVSNDKVAVTYSFCIKKEKDSFAIKSELLKYQTVSLKGEGTSRKIVNFDTDSENYYDKFMTDENLSYLKKNFKENFKLLQAFLLLNKNMKESFIFGSQNFPLFHRSFTNTSIAEVLIALRRFAASYLFVFRNEFSAKIMEGNEFQLSYSKELENQRLLGQFIYKYSNGPISLLLPDLERWKKIIKNINIVLRTIIPNMEIVIPDNAESDFTRDGKEYKKIFLFSSRNGVPIPLKYESDGIKKIISILGIIIDMYNNPMVTLVVDELDSGIFEYLLGEIVKILEESGKGQFIFTSHNLRPLELLNYKSLYFTTVNPKHRYTQLSAIKTNNNVRKVYYTALQLGTADDDLYEMVDDFQIRDALIESGGDAEVFNG